MESIECYSDEELYEGIQEIVSSSVVGACLAPSDKPQAILLGGQSGAGKTTLHNVFRNAMNGNVIVVNGDEYRSFHPRYKQICAQYGIDSPAHTAAWAGRMVEAIIDALSIMGYNLIIEGTLRTSEVPLETARLLRDRGYSVSLALMAVKPEISLISCQLRYEQMRIAGRSGAPPFHRQEHRRQFEGVGRVGHVRRYRPVLAQRAAPLLQRGRRRTGERSARTHPLRSMDRRRKRSLRISQATPRTSKGS